MTAVEFFDRTPIENVISAITTCPDKIIYIGNGRIMDKWKGVYSNFLKERGLKTVLEFRDTQGKSIEETVELLSEIAESDSPCVFEITGGSECALVAMGIVFDRYRHRDIQMQHFRVKGNRVIDCDGDGAVVLENVPELYVREIVGLYGGIAKFESYGSDDGQVSENLARDVEKMWSICKKSPKVWNFHTGVIASLSNMSTAGDLNVSVPTDRMKSHLRGDIKRERELKALLSSLEEKGIVKDFVLDGEKISFRFKSTQVKKCLTKAGTVLELWVLISALRLKSSRGESVYTDGLSGVHIEWAGALKHGNTLDTENEIDVILTHGVTPVFISCKNGHINDSELYKLDAVANRFGGEYAKKVLICTDTGSPEKTMAHLRQRAHDMNIKFVEGVHRMSCDQFENTLKGLYQ